MADRNATQNIWVKLHGAQNAEAQFKSLGATILKNIAGYVSLGIAISKTADFLKSSVQAAAAQELAERKLQSALGKTSQMLINQASALQRTTRYSDDAVISAQALIATYVKDEKAVRELTKGTLDFASAMGVDLQTAALLVAKSAGSSTNALARYGIELEKIKDPAERINVLQGKLAEKFGGRAAAEVETYAGKMDRLKNSYDDFQETVGKVFLAVEKSSALTNLLTMMWGSLNQSLDAAIIKNAALAGNWEFLNNYLGNNVEVTKEVANVTDEASTATEKMNIQLSIYSANLDDIQKRNVAGKQAKALWQMKESGVKAFDALDKSVLEYADKVQNIAWQMSDVWAAALQNQWDQGQSFFQNMARGFEQMLASMVAQLASRAAIFSIFSMFGGGGLLGGFSQFLFKGYQHGGSFTVGGSGAADSQLVAFRASPGERVTVTPPVHNQTNNMHFNFSGSITRRQIQNEVIPEIKRAVRLGMA